MTARASQVVVQALVQSAAAPVHASQTIAQVLVQAVGVRASQTIVQALARAGNIYASQIVARILLWNHPMTTPAVYPTLPGLAYNVVKRPVFYNTTAKSGSGWTVRFGFASTPTWEWDLEYEVLRDFLSPAEKATLLGFYLATNGNLSPFLFQDPDDYKVTGQAIGTTDGSTTNFTLIRTYGAGGNTGNEPIGYVNTGATFNVYLNGTLQSPTTYTINTAVPVNQQIKFTTAPSAGQSITVDMSYYYYVGFKDASLDFENFAFQYWAVKKITLTSFRG